MWWWTKAKRKVDLVQTDIPSRVVILRRGRVFHFGLLRAQTTNYDTAVLDLLLPKSNNNTAILLTLRAAGFVR
jgi:hypothetical protein